MKNHASVMDYEVNFHFWNIVEKLSFQLFAT